MKIVELKQICSRPDVIEVLCYDTLWVFNGWYLNNEGSGLHFCHSVKSLNNGSKVASVFFSGLV
jgi:hypothetical protein